MMAYTSMRFLPAPRWLALLLTLLPFAGWAQSACTISQQRASTNVTVATESEADADTVLSIPIRGWGTSLVNCEYSTTVNVKPVMPQLTYVRDVIIAGTTYPAYGWSATSSLVVFRYRIINSLEYYDEPLRLDRETPITFISAGGPIFQLAVGLVARGGPIIEERVDLGVVETSVAGSPSTRLYNSASVDIRPSSHSCRVRTDATVSLAPVQQHQLQRPGDSAAEQAAPARVRCSSAGLVARVRIDDAMDPGNISSVLTAASGTTASGVAVQLLRGGIPLAMGSQWDVTSDFSWIDQDLSARYIRTIDALTPGDIVGEAVITADLK
ncbi:UNVERIFIED_ORG: type 1 fimbria pilin [Stenotrophomonas maltophilia]